MTMQENFFVHNNPNITSEETINGTRRKVGMTLLQEFTVPLPQSEQNAITYSAFYCHVCETCNEKNFFLENDEHWGLALTEASGSDTQRKFRNLFCNYAEQVPT